MQLSRIIKSVVLLSGLGLTVLQAQESVNATGTDTSGTGGSVSYSIGQVFNQVYTGSNGSVSEGVQQPYEISVITGIELIAINLIISAYPNPTFDYLTLQVKDLNLSNLSYQLYDMQGRLLQNEKITSNLTTIFMSNLLPAIYILKVTKDNKDCKTFKIIKK